MWLKQGDKCFIYEPKSWENRSFFIGDGDSKYYGCFFNGVNAGIFTIMFYTIGGKKSFIDVLSPSFLFENWTRFRDFFGVHVYDFIYLDSIIT